MNFCPRLHQKLLNRAVISVSANTIPHINSNFIFPNNCYILVYHFLSTHSILFFFQSQGSPVSSLPSFVPLNCAYLVERPWKFTKQTDWYLEYSSQRFVQWQRKVAH